MQKYAIAIFFIKEIYDNKKEKNRLMFIFL